MRLRFEKDMAGSNPNPDPDPNPNPNPNPYPNPNPNPNPNQDMAGFIELKLTHAEAQARLAELEDEIQQLRAQR